MIQNFTDLILSLKALAAHQVSFVLLSMRHTTVKSKLVTEMLKVFIDCSNGMSKDFGIFK